MMERREEEKETVQREKEQRKLDRIKKKAEREANTAERKENAARRKEVAAKKREEIRQKKEKKREEEEKKKRKQLTTARRHVHEKRKHVSSSSSDSECSVHYMESDEEEELDIGRLRCSVCNSCDGPPEAWVGCDCCPRWCHIICSGDENFDGMTDEEVEDYVFVCSACLC